MKDPRWMSRLVVEAIHLDQIREHGGFPGLRDEALLESAMARPQNKFSYRKRCDLATLAAAYTFGILRNHPFQDGNKRTAFLTGVTFLGLNGADFEANQEKVVEITLGAAAGAVGERELEKWFRSRSSEGGN